MPIIVKLEDVEWSEAGEALYINVPLKGVPAHKADSFSNNMNRSLGFTLSLYSLKLMTCM
jgi:hypothetical protein